MTKKLKLGFLASHNGSNMQAIIDNINTGSLDAEACVVISNNSDSGAIRRAEKEQILHFHISSKTHPGDGAEDKAIADALETCGVDLVILAGYMKKIGSEVLARFHSRILNIHPALLPKYGGKGMYGRHVHEAVLAAGDTVTGATVHVVDEIYDNGKILARMSVPVMPGDDAERLAARVLKAEHKLYSDTIQKIAGGEITI